ncbi:hypothetical protein BpHYR1_018079 [Brachionus plicatilis]|uniref:Uncharacterized protein n=1 Tax=Brachionus plicatilis TaxID=10195 RepID=A0A3M7R6V8_BRAPC|nr:hypothetical protein BpHYR1_018079 [Brachionus plicatilis]
MSTGDEQSDDKFDVEEVDRNTTELPLNESGGEDEVEVVEIPCTSARKTTASDLVTSIKSFQKLLSQTGVEDKKGEEDQEKKTQKPIKLIGLTNCPYKQQDPIFDMIIGIYHYLQILIINLRNKGVFLGNMDDLWKV